MKLYILLSIIILFLFSPKNASSRTLTCEEKLVCGSDGQVYENSCDFKQALRLHQDLEILPLHECFDFFYIVVTPEQYSALSGMRMKSTLISGRKFFLIPIIGAAARYLAVKAVKEVGKAIVKGVVSEVVDIGIKGIKKIVISDDDVHDFMDRDYEF